MTTYHIWAEHTGGQSLSHPCRKGVYDDPAERLDMTVEAESEEAAELHGMAELRRIVADYQPCDCERGNRLIGDAWWDSVVVTASRDQYPSYVGDFVD